jgi:hypothetical protein
MSGNERPVTDFGLLALLRFDPARHAQPAAKARVLGRLETTIGVLGGAALQASSETIPRANRSASGGESALVSQTRAATSARPPLRTMWSLAGQPAAIVTAAFLLGGVGGAGLYAALAPPRQRTAYVDRPVAVPEPRPFAVEPFNRAPAAATPDTEIAGPAKARGNPAPIASPLAAERELLDRARKALARGDTPDAERALDLHARRHPGGILLEEREALAIKVLVDLGRAEEARRRAGKFKDRYPRSLFGPAVDEAMSTIR